MIHERIHHFKTIKKAREILYHPTPAVGEGATYACFISFTEY